MFNEWFWVRLHHDQLIGMIRIQGVCFWPGITPRTLHLLPVSRRRPPPPLYWTHLQLVTRCQHTGVLRGGLSRGWRPLRPGLTPSHQIHAPQWLTQAEYITMITLIARIPWTLPVLKKDSTRVAYPWYMVENILLGYPESPIFGDNLVQFLGTI